MKCQNCGAEIDAHSTTCSYCGASISYEMRKEQEQVNKQGCPKCGSSNITFEREKQGDLKGKRGTTVVRQTVGVCKDCGYTWKADDSSVKRKSPVWLWVLGWIFIFPLPLTILLLRKKDMKPALKYGIIAAAWIVYLLFVFIGRSKNSGKDKTQTVVTTQTVIASVEEETTKATTKATTAATTEASVAETTAETDEDGTDTDSENGLVDPELKAFLDSYEEYMDSYIEFMQKMADNPDDLTIMAEYANMMLKYNEFAAAIEKYDSDEDMSEADRLYYIEVITRVEQKLLEASVTLPE